VLRESKMVSTDRAVQCITVQTMKHSMMKNTLETFRVYSLSLLMQATEQSKDDLALKLSASILSRCCKPTRKRRAR